LPGMLGGDTGLRFDGDPPHDWEAEYPDITDPATLGCIVQLVRDAWRRPKAYLYCYGRSWFFEPQQPDPTNHPSGRTEAETLLHALQAASGVDDD